MAHDSQPNGHANGNASGTLGDNYPTRSYDARYKTLPVNDGPSWGPGRLNTFIGGYYKDYNLSALLDAHRLDDEKHVKLEYWNPGPGKPSPQEALKQTFQPAKKGLEIGPNWSNHWFKVTINIPKEFAEYERVQFEFDCAGEAMIFDTEGNPYHGLTGGHNVDRRVEFIIPKEHRKAGVGHYFIEASCNGMFGFCDDMFGEHLGEGENKKFILATADLVVPNMEALRLKYDFEYLVQLSSALPENSSLRQRAKWTANEMMNAFKRGDLSSCKAARDVAQNVFGKNWEKLVAEECKTPEKQDGTLWALGHCHIDTAWLWPYSVTQQKSARSWSTQCDLIDRYPEYVFTVTQPQQFKWVEKLYPTLFERIMTKVAEGRFQPLGCTWVEMDTNMPSGEALVRQFLYGQRYFEKRFGARSKTFVLPDTFGYSSQLPQISRLSGAANFFTQKLSWNNINGFPHSTFNWVGIDGSQVLTHMTPVSSYNAQVDVEELRRGLLGHKNNDVTKQALLLFGNGDGGGGPTAPMLEKLRRTRAIGNNSDDSGGQLPQIKNGGSFEEFYETVRAETDNGRKLPIWRGELYFELHRGTYTSQASIKKGNRKSENLMREAEYAATMASLHDKSYVYPKDRLDAAWEDLLLNQFHDVLPGSSISEVYVDAEEIYERLQRVITEVINEAHDVLYKGTTAVGPKGVISEGVVALNPLPGYARREIIKVPAGTEKTGQASADGKHEYVVVDATGTTDLALPTTVSDVKATATKTGDNTFELANSSIKATIADGRITSIVDLALKKELIAPGQTGGFVIFEDQPEYWDAWDVDIDHLQKAQPLKFDNVSIGEEGPLRASLNVSAKYGKSTISAEVSLDAIAASLRPDARSLIRFETTVDWAEKHDFLKFELPLNIYSDNATYDTQFGVLSRPTHRNTSWDAAKFEVCAHRFADLSQWGYGVALLNDCKYGYATLGNVMRLSLLRSPRMPDNNADMGKHEFSFAIYPHVGSFGESDVAPVSSAFNHPLRIRGGVAAAKDAAFTGSPFSVLGAPNVVLETIKRGEDDEGDMRTVILRLFEQYGGQAEATLKVAGLSVKKAEVVNLLEDHMGDLEVSASGEIQVPFGAFEIKTVRLTL